jgi:hypothetical protein
MYLTQNGFRLEPFGAKPETASLEQETNVFDKARGLSLT